MTLRAASVGSNFAFSSSAPVTGSANAAPTSRAATHTPSLRHRIISKFLAEIESLRRGPQAVQTLNTTQGRPHFTLFGSTKPGNGSSIRTAPRFLRRIWIHLDVVEVDLRDLGVSEQSR